MSFTIPLTGSTIVTTAAVETTYSAPAYHTDSTTPTCSGGVCIAMSCGGGSFTPDGAYDSPWDNVKPKFDVTKLIELHTGGDVDDSLDVERPEAEHDVNKLTAEVAAAEVVHSVAGDVQCRPSNPRGVQGEGGVETSHPD